MSEEVSRLSDGEYPLPEILAAEVINPASIYYAEEVFLIKIAHGADGVWYKSVVGAETEKLGDLAVWFRIDELRIYEEESEDEE